MKTLILLISFLSFSFCTVIQTTSYSCPTGYISNNDSVLTESVLVDCSTDMNLCSDTFFYDDVLLKATQTIYTYISSSTSRRKSYSMTCQIDNNVPSDYICSDGGISLNGSCDRTCESVGLVSTYNPNYHVNIILDSGSTTNYTDKLICTSSFTCDSSTSQCINKCGSLENILNMNCSEPNQIFDCTCKTSTTPTLNVIFNGNLSSNETLDITADSSTISNDTKQLSNDIKTFNNNVLQLNNDIRTSQQTIDDSINKNFTKTNDILELNTKQLIENNENIKKNSDTLSIMNSNLTTGLNSVNSNLSTLSGQLTYLNNNIDSLTVGGSVDTSNIDSSDSAVLADNENFRNLLLTSANGVISDLESTLNNVTNRFSFTAPSGGDSNITFSAFGTSTSIDLCEPISPLSGIFSILITIIILIVSARIYFFGFLLFKGGL